VQIVFRGVLNFGKHSRYILERKIVLFFTRNNKMLANEDSVH
jgi:hypothetical protein